MVSIEICGITNSSIDVCLTGSITEYTGDDKYVNWYISTDYGDMMYYGVQHLLSHITSSDIFTFSGLDKNHVYYICAEINYTADGTYESVMLDTVCAKTDCSADTSRPDRFYWITDKLPKRSFNITADEWNGLLDNINAVRNYKGMPDYSFTYARRDESFKASMYNEVVCAIQELTDYKSGLHTVSKKYVIYADLLNDLIAELNSVV